MRSPASIFFLVLAGSIFLAACSFPGRLYSPPAQYTIGGRVSGLLGTGLVLLENGGNSLAVGAGATSFTFAGGIVSGGSYNVTISSQPSNPAQTCRMSDASGPVANANIISVQITCTTNVYTISGTVSGLTGTGLVLQDNGGNNLAIGAGATSFTFSTGIASGGSYDVAVSSQASSPSQICGVTAGSGTVTNANIGSVEVTCATSGMLYAIGGTVTGLTGAGGGLVLQDNDGDNLLVNENGPFTFPTMIAGGASYSVTIFAQPSSPPDNCIVLNGSGTVTGTVTSVLVECANSPWTWMKGSDSLNQAGIYGNRGAGAAANTPGARQHAVTWTDLSGNLWLFGGFGYDSAGNLSYLSDLWEYTAGNWVWIGGPSVVNQNGIYGTLRVADSGNVPGARYGAAGWTDRSGNFWLFGGNGLDSVGSGAWLNDLWKYSGGQWTWMGGSQFADQHGAYGTEGVSAASNVPGGRAWPASGIDSSGDFWLFGGQGYDSSSAFVGDLNDLWKYSGGQWTWVSGADLANQLGIYGTQGTPAAGNVPGARIAAAGWSDPSGNLWVFGGTGYISSGSSAGPINDLWKYDGREWTWESGSSFFDEDSVFGTAGVPSPANTPSARVSSGSWVDSSGNLWLFGGTGDTSAGPGDLNDLWEYSGGQWAWVSGSQLPDAAGIYGTQGVPSAGTVPGGRFNPSSHWIDTHGNLWLFGGYGPVVGGGDLNDLWRYTPN